MDFTGQNTIAADRATVWAHLIDPETLKACIPGCDSFTGTLADGYEAVIRQKVGFIPVTVTVSIKVEPISLPDRYRIVASGQGGIAGHGSGVARITLTEKAGGTVLDYVVHAELSGRLSKLGQPIVDAVTAKLAERFFERFQNAVDAAG